MGKAKWLRDSWIDFFTSRGFVDVSDRSVIPPESDRSLLFINSGVAAIKSYFCGDSSIPCHRLCSAQRVVRTGDIDSIGRSFRHHTYFEMLGNFSVGSVSRSEAIDLAWEFLVKGLGLDGERLYVTVFGEDEESYGTWRSHLPKQRIIRCGRETNFWDMGVGPCGPCTEIYYDRGEDYDEEGRGAEMLAADVENRRFLEIWNLVFSDYLNVDGKIIASPTKNLDTGAGLERLLVVLEGAENTFETSLFAPIIGFLEGHVEEGEDRSGLWASADYFRTCCVLIRDGVGFGNRGREYVLRRIFRRACEALVGRKKQGFFGELAEVIAGTLDYYDWSGVLGEISGQMWGEYGLVIRNREASEALMERVFGRCGETVSAKEIFGLVTRDGLPLGLLEKEMEKRGLSYSRQEYGRLFEEHKSRSCNENISSAFVKQVPSLMERSEPTVFDYEAAEKESGVRCLYVGEEFRKWDGVVKEGESVHVVLEETVVFPAAAGQEADLGWMMLPDEEGEWSWVKIEASLKAANGQILHRFVGLSSEALEYLAKEGARVRVSHDTERRRRLEMNHTGEHLVYAVLRKLVNGDICRVSGGKRAEGFSLEIRVPEGVEKGDFDLARIHGELRRAVGRAIEVTTEIGTLERAREMGIVGRFEEIYEMNRDNLRFVGIGEYGTELCVGTHVRNTREIEEIMIVKFGKSKRSEYRIQAVTGRDAVAEALGECGTAEEYVFRMQNREALEKKKREEDHGIFVERKRELMEALLGCEGSVKVLEWRAEQSVAAAVFREIRGHLAEGDIVGLYWGDGEAYRFYVAGRGVDVGQALGRLREKGAKCGGNSSFGSGMYEGEGFGGMFAEAMEKCAKKLL